MLLRLGLYQMFWLDRIPDHAAVNETVALARQLGYGPQSGFINAVLRGIARERDETRKSLEELKDNQPALGYSHPDWLCERWQTRWGGENLGRLLGWNNTPPKLYARLNALRGDGAKLLEEGSIRFKSCSVGRSLFDEIQAKAERSSGSRLGQVANVRVRPDA